MRDYEPILTSILSAASSGMASVGVPLSLVHLAPGQQVAWDSCCEGAGQLYLRLGDVFPTAGPGVPFPGKDGDQKGAGCGIRLLAMRLHLGVIRCAHTIDNTGEPPSAAQMTSDAVRAVDDMALLLDVIACVVPGLAGVMGMKVDRWTPQGVLGGCAGGEWTFYIGVDPCLCAPPAG